MTSRFRVLLAAAAIALPVLAAERTLPPEMTGIPGKIGVASADPVTTGSFEGTWIYVNCDGKFALWIRNEGGTPRMRLQYQSTRNGEAFESDWDGKAKYFFSGVPADFDMTIDHADADKISGHWTWNFDAGSSARLEKADLLIQRTAYGRSMKMDFLNYEKTIRQSGGDKVFRMPVTWGWTKVSKRELLWDELPF